MDVTETCVICVSGLALCEQVSEALQEWREQAAGEAVAADPHLIVEGYRLTEWTSKMRAAIANTQAQA